MPGQSLGEFLLEIGLDSKRLNEGMRGVMDKLRKDSAEITAMGASIEAGNKKFADAFKDIKRTALELTGLFLGGRGIIEFIGHLTHLEFATGMVAKQMDLMPEKLSAWQGVMRQIGGTAEGMTQSLASLQDIAVQARFGNISAQTAGVFNVLGANPRELDPTKQLEQLGAGVDRLRRGGTNPAMITGLLKMLGMDQDMINLLFLDPRKREEMLQQQEKLFIVHQKDTEAAKELTIAWGQLEQAMFGTGATIANTAFPWMTKLANVFTKFIEDSPAAEKALAGFAAILAGMGTLPVVRWLLGGGAFSFLLGSGIAPAAAAGAGWWNLMGMESPTNPERQQIEKNWPWFARQWWGDTPDERARIDAATKNPESTHWSKDEVSAQRAREKKFLNAINPLSGDDMLMPSQIRSANPNGIPGAVLVPTPNERIGAAFSAFGPLSRAASHTRLFHHQNNTSRATNIHVGQIMMPNVHNAKDFVRDMPVEANRRAAQVASVAETGWVS